MIICSFGGSTRTRNLFAFSDGSLEKIGNCKSRLGGVIFMGYDSGAIYNESVQDLLLIRQLKLKSEHVSDQSYQVTVVYTTGILTKWLGIPIYIDNEALMHISESIKEMEKLKHINTCVQYMRD